jgi:hypothetical protein
MTKFKPKMTIAEALGEGNLWECTMDDCHLPFQSQKALEGYETKSIRLVQKRSDDCEEMGE